MMFFIFTIKVGNVYEKMKWKLLGYCQIYKGLYGKVNDFQIVHMHVAVIAGLITVTI